MNVRLTKLRIQREMFRHDMQLVFRAWGPLSWDDARQLWRKARIEAHRAFYNLN